MKRPENITICITDDDEEDRDFIIAALINKGYKGKTKTFENGAYLLDYLADQTTGKCDMVLLDLNMPGKNGYQTLKEIKENSSLNETPVVIFTSSTKKEDEILCRKLGAEEFIKKPLTFSEYATVAENILQLSDQLLSDC